METKPKSVWKTWSALLVPPLLFSLVATADLLVQRLEPLLAFNYLALAFRGLRFGLFVGAFACFFGRWARFLYVPVWIWFCLVLAIEAVARFNFSMILDGCWIMLAAGSSTAEMKTLLGEFRPFVVLPVVIALILVSTMGCHLFWRLPLRRPGKLALLLGILWVLPFGVLDMGPRTRMGAFDALIAFHLPMDTFQNRKNMADMARVVREPCLPLGLRLSASVDHMPLGVVVIGESATCQDWGLYGYARPTTPCLSALEDELLVFRDVTSAYPFTSMSLKTVFTEATRENPNDARCTFAQKCLSVGYGFSLLSAQDRWSRWEGVEKLLFSACDDKWYLSEQPTSVGESRYDDALLLPLFERLRRAAPRTTPEIVCVHLMGSHFEPRDRFPADQRVFPRYYGDFPPDLDEASSPWNIQAVNDYDNSIVFTDALLGRILDELKTIQRPVFFVYFSDHGETPRASNWRVSTHPDIFKVPLVVWLSPAYRTAYPQVVDAIRRQVDGPFRLDHLQSSLLLPLAQITQ